MFCSTVEDASLTQATDNTLWLKFKEGDSDAFSALYQRYFDVMVKVCLHISQDIEIIKDCIHDLFIDMWISSDRLALPVSVKAYLIRSVQRKVIRKLKRYQQYYCDLPVETLHQYYTVSPVEEKMITAQLKQEQKGRIIRAIGVLTRRQQEIVYLKFFYSLSYPEIAEKMCISTASIYNLISKAIGNMQGIISKTNFPTC